MQKKMTKNIMIHNTAGFQLTEYNHIIEATNYHDYLENWGGTETNTPHGVDKIDFIEEVEDEYQDEDEDRETLVVHIWQLRRRIGDGSEDVFVESFDSEEDAKQALLAQWERNLQKLDNVPIFHQSIASAVLELKDRLGLNKITII